MTSARLSPESNKIFNTCSFSRLKTTIFYPFLEIIFSCNCSGLPALGSEQAANEGKACPSRLALHPSPLLSPSRSGCQAPPLGAPSPGAFPGRSLPSACDRRCGPRGCHATEISNHPTVLFIIHSKMVCCYKNIFAHYINRPSQQLPKCCSYKLTTTYLGQISARFHWRAWGGRARCGVCTAGSSLGKGALERGERPHHPGLTPYFQGGHPERKGLTQGHT